MSGGQSFFVRAEIKDLCAWLRLLVNPDDDPAFLRAVTTPKRGIRHITLGNLGEFAAKWQVSLFEARFSPTLPTLLKGKAADLLHDLDSLVRELQHRAAYTRGSEDAKALLLGWLKDIGYQQHLYDGEDSEKLAATRWTNVLDFVDWSAVAARSATTAASAKRPSARPCCRWRRPSASSSAWPSAMPSRT